MDAESPSRYTRTPGSGSSALTLLGAAGLGAALMYYLDPERGARRRHRVIDQLVHARRVADDALASTGRDMRNRSRGVAMGARSRLRVPFWRGATDDRVVEERVRSRMGRVVSHPGAIVVTARDGHVTLSGPVLGREADRLLAAVRAVRGVRAVVNQLEVHETAEGVPALQGGTRRPLDRPELLQEHWAPATRLVTSATGTALAAYGVRRRDGLGTALGLAGFALAARGLTNQPPRRLVGVGAGRRAVDIQKTISIHAPAGRVYAFLTEWECWPQWMSHVREVTTRGLADGQERTHWVVDGPLGVPVAWDAITTRLVPDSEVAWKSETGAVVEHAGRIRLTPTGDGATRVEVRMSYNPPAGMVGHAVAAFFSRDAKRQMDDDLARLKTTIETGTPPRDAARPAAAPAMPVWSRTSDAEQPREASRPDEGAPTAIS